MDVDVAGASLDGVVVELGSFTIGPCDLDIGPGEVVALRGANGSGKSTLLRVLLGLQRPTSGSVKVNGAPVTTSCPPTGAGAVLDVVGFYDWLSGPTNLRLAAEGERKPEARADRLLSEVGLDGVGEKPVSAYSRGMLQRLALARALLWDPTLLVLDEPTTGLDAAGQAWLVERVLAAKQKGLAVVVATHDPAFAESVADRTVEIARGALRPVEA